MVDVKVFRGVFMKKICVLLLVCLFLFSLTGCSEPGVDSFGNEGSEKLETTTEETTEEKSSEGEPLVYTMKEETIEFPLSDGTLYYRNIVKYPYFEGDSGVEKTLNDRYSEIIENFKNNDTDFDKAYEESKEWATTNPPYYDDIEAEVSYNENGVISIKETSVMFSGGLHAYYEISGITYDTVTGKELKYTDILKDSESEIDKALSSAMEKALGYEANDYMLSSLKTYSGYVLCDEGLCFYCNVGDAVPRVEVIIPYTDENSYVIEIGASAATENTEENTAAKPEKAEESEEKPTEAPQTSEEPQNTFTERELSASELEYFSLWLNPSNEYYNNCFLTSHYNDPTEIDPDQLIYSYQEIFRDIDDEDRAVLISDLGYTEDTLSWIYISKYKREDIDRVLREKAGVSLDQLKTPISYQYSEKTDSYYLARSDTNLGTVNVIYGREIAPDKYVIGYTGAPGQLYSGTSEVTFTKAGEELVFYSNVKVG